MNGLETPEHTNKQMHKHKHTHKHTPDAMVQWNTIWTRYYTLTNTLTNILTNTHMHAMEYVTIYLKPLPFEAFRAWHVTVSVRRTVHSRGTGLFSTLNVVTKHVCKAKQL